MMDNFELNKIAGAVLSSVLFVIFLQKLSGLFFNVSPPATPGYDVAVASVETGGGNGHTAAPAVPLGQLLASANAERGATLSAKKCLSCHSFGEGEKSKIGPNLRGVAGRAIASVEGFPFSASLKEIGGIWTWENLNHFIASPKDFASRTKMTYIGVKNDQERADILLYLKSISPNAPALPSK